MKVICRDRRQRTKGAAPESRAVSSVATDVDRILAPKSYDELEDLEKVIRKKLDSNDPNLDVDWWEQLLRSLTVCKARAKLKRVYQSVIENRLQALRQQQEEEAETVRRKLQTILGGRSVATERCSGDKGKGSVTYDKNLDPEPLLKLRPEDKALELVDEKAFLQSVVS